MIKNVFLKNLLINTVFSGISVVNSIVKKDDKQILLYSDLGFRDNLKYLYDYLVEEGYDKRYKIIVASSGLDDTVKKNSNIQCVGKMKAVLSFLRSGHVYYCFGKLPIRPAKGQSVCQMWHGSSFKGFSDNQKKTSKNDKMHLFYTHVFAASEFFVPIVADKFSVPSEVVCVAGHPRTDVMVRNKDADCYQLKENIVSENIGNTVGTESIDSTEKIVLWLPTFRKSEKMGMKDGDAGRLVPILDKEDFEEMDKKLKEIHMKLIIKLHPMQDVSGESVEYTNLKLLSHSEFVEKGYDLYKLLSDADALITDYSSVFYDYLLLNRPIGFTEDDVELYKDTRGFAVDPEKFRPGLRIRTKQDLILFLAKLSKGEDDYRFERDEILALTNAYHDDKNCKRALEICGIQ